MRMKTLKTVLITLAVCAFMLVPSVKARAQVKTMPDGMQFDPSFYAATYDDVYRAFGMNEALLYQHYLLCGIAEKRLPYAGAEVGVNAPANAASGTVLTMPDGGLFDPIYYANKNPDVVAVYGILPINLYTHYLYCGVLEGRLPYEGYRESDVKLVFSTTAAAAAVQTPADVVSAVRQAAKYRVTDLQLLSVWRGELSADEMTVLLNAQAPYLKNFYGAKISVSAPKIYGLSENPTIELRVSLKF